MSRELDVQAELRKLAHTLDVGVEDLTMLDGVPTADLRTLRAQIGEAMFQAGRPAFARVATLSKTVPGAVAAKLTELALPPLIAARVAELLEPARAVDMVMRLPNGYLADVSSVLDPARAPDVVAAIPLDRVATISAELARREEWVVIGSFVSHVPPEALRASVAVYDGAQLLRIGFVLDDLSKVDTIVGMLSDHQVDAVLAAAPADGLWAELSEMAGHLQPPRIARLAQRYAAADSLHAAYRAAAEAGELDEAALAGLTA